MIFFGDEKTTHILHRTEKGKFDDDNDNDDDEEVDETKLQSDFQSKYMTVFKSTKPNCIEMWKRTRN